ncbi:MAG: radical SAM protein [Elusimicrobiota bacterium]|jgi:MoaA/NifB/PqqE/SkfB family radical SAM enzyme
MKEFDQFIDQLSEDAKARPQWIQATVELTYGCNLRCVHCYNTTHEAKQELTTEQVYRLLDEMAAQGCLWIGFTGGEVFTRRDACEIMRYARSLGMVITITTNATLITPALADQMAELDPYLVEISVYGATADSYESVTRIPGSYAHFVEGVDWLKERHIPILLKLVLMTLNEHELEPMKDFARSRQLPYRIGTDIYPRVDGSKEPLMYRLSPARVFEIWRENSGKPMQEAGGSLEGKCGSAGKLFDCLCGKSNAALTPHGRMNLCVCIHHPSYDVTAGSVEKGWQTLVKFVAAQKPGPAYACSSCPIAFHCDRGSMDGWLDQKAFDAPCMPYFREVAEKKAMFIAQRES